MGSWSPGVGLILALLWFAADGAPGAQAAPAPAAAAPAAAAPAASASGEAAFSVVLKDGTVVPCVEAPVVALGRVLYRTADGVRRALPVDRVDLDKTRPQVAAQLPRVPAAAPPTREGSAVPVGHGAAGVAGRRLASDPAARRAAPDFAATSLAGKDVKLSDLKGKVVLVDFWASWCGPCVVEMPHIKALAERHAKDDFAILGVSLDHDRAKLDAFVKAKDLTWPQAFDGKGWGNSVARTYGVSSIPATVLVDRAGRVAVTGARGAMLDSAIAELLAEKKTKSDATPR